MRLTVQIVCAIFLGCEAANAEYLGRDALERRDLLKHHHAFNGLVIPNLGVPEGVASDALTLASREAIRGRMDKDDNGGSFGTRWVGYSTTFAPGLPLVVENHLAAVELARSSGFQGTVWGEASPYEYGDEFDGFAVRINFSYAGEYEDYRENNKEDLRLENWIVTYDGYELSVPIPSSFVSLPPHLMTAETYNNFADDDICYVAEGGGVCLPYSQVGPTRLVSIDRVSGSAKFIRFGQDEKYMIDFPAEIFAATDSLAYVTMFFNYARGHWSNTIEDAETVINGELSSGLMIRDAHLYMAAAMFRGGLDGSASLELAKALTPFSAEVSQFSIAAALLKFRAGKITRNEWEATLSSERVFIHNGWLQQNRL